MKRFYAMEKIGNEATLNIYGDISSWSDTNAKSLAQQLDEMADVSKINVYVNSYGGEVAEGLAIYNALRRHKAKVITHCDGFACSIASVIFMAGDERVMSDSSLLMIHNAWTYAEGNADALRKQADDLDKITEASITAYKTHSTLSEKEIKKLMNEETWITPSEALEYGFATAIEKSKTDKASQNARAKMFEILTAYNKKQAEKDEDEEAEDIDTEENDEEAEVSPENEPETDDNNEDDEEGEEQEKGDKTENKASERLYKIFNSILK